MAGKDLNKGARPVQFGFAKELRKQMTTAEQKLWQALRGNKLLGLRFRRQHPIGKYILDFYCHKIDLGIEIDGGYHTEPEQQDYDFGREFELKELGITVLRFTNSEIDMRLQEVIQKINTVAEAKLRSAPSSK